jgi:hypothetical protein
MLSGSTLPFEYLRVPSSVEGLTALSTSKGYRSMSGPLFLQRSRVPIKVLKD